MHASSFENMAKCFARHIAGGPLEDHSNVSVLDIGGADINGSYRDVFSHPRFAYTAADLAPGEGVHLVLDDPYKLPINDGSIDIVVSGQMLEHCEFFWLSFGEMIRVMKPDGYLFLIAPSAGPEHRFPVDCYRFYPDAYRALARYANCDLVDVWCDDRGPWKDLVGVFRRRGRPPVAEPRPLRTELDPASMPPGTEEEERIAGEAEYLVVLEDLHRAIEPLGYLEIGVRFGRSLALARGPAIGIDPRPELQSEQPGSTRIYAQTSDDFFATSATSALTEPVELAFIDGLHQFEAALRDFMNIERVAAPGAIIAIDDVLPNHQAQALRERRTRAWTGDVWKMIGTLKRWRPDLVIVLLDVSPAGCLLVGNLNPSDRTFWEGYNPIVREQLGLDEPPLEVLHRKGAVATTSPAYAEFIQALSDARRDAARRIDALRQLAARPASVAVP